MQRVQDAQQHFQQVQAHHDYLTQLKNHYQNSTVIEREAREQLGYIRPGEHPVVVISSANQGSQNVSNQSSAPMQQGFWQEWWNSLFGG